MKFQGKRLLFFSLIGLATLTGCETPYETSAPTHYHSPYYYNTYAPSSDPVYSPVVYDPYPYPYPYYGYPYYYGWGHRHRHWR